MSLQLRNFLKDFLPESALDYFVDIFSKNTCSIHIKRDRKTRLGSFVVKENKLPLITINGNLNIYFFAVVLAHELAHFFIFQKYGKHKVKAHGTEWKREYMVHLNELISRNVFIDDIKNALTNCIKTQFESKNAEFELQYILYKKQHSETQKTILKDLGTGVDFGYRGASFRKLENRRSKCLCVRTDVGGERKYLFHLLTIVET